VGCRCLFLSFSCFRVRSLQHDAYRL
jgi:hypothetical protein